MFESNDWDLDQDLLNDVDERASDYYSHLDSQEVATKKRKIDIDDSPAHFPNVDSLRTGAVDKGEDKRSRKNLILGLFNKNSSSKNVSQGALTEPTRSCDNPLNQTDIESIPGCANDQLPRKNLVLNILQNNNSRSQEITKDNTKKLKTVVPKNESKSNARPENSVFKSPQKKMTLVRKFPGPAGLLPDDIDSNITCNSYLKKLEESEVGEDNNTTDLPTYCSQNTTNLFTEGAWQLMLNDLPRDFLNGYNIASIKQKAALNGRNNIKVKFLAGIVEHIDYSHENPPIVLKDFTDSIRGIVHKDIPLKYPGLLESNVVLLLRDVGLLKISGIFAANKCQILISPSSLLAIYTRKCTIERTEHMESMFRDSVNRRKTDDHTLATTSSTDIHYASQDKNKFDNDMDTDILKDFDSDLSSSEVTDLRNDFNESTSKTVTEESKKKQNSGESSGKKENLSSGYKEKTKLKDLFYKDLKRFAFDPDEKENEMSNWETATTGKASEKKLTEIESDPDDELLSQIDMDF